MGILKMGRKERQEALWGYLFIAPTLVLLGVFTYLALGASFLISFSDWDVFNPAHWVGLSNYRAIFKDPIFTKSIGNTLRFVLISLPVGQGLALILALILNSKALKFRNFYRLVYFIPGLTMPVAIAVIWKFIYNPLYGPIALLFQSLGLEPISWLTDVNYGLISIAIIAVWSGIGYHMIIMLAGLQNIDQAYYDAAQVDGANKWQQLRHITLPLLTPTLFFTIITSFIGGFQMFDLVYIMTKGGPMNSTRTIVMYIYEEGIRNFRFGGSNAAAWVLFLIIMSITVFQLRMQNRWVHYE